LAPRVDSKRASLGEYYNLGPVLSAGPKGSIILLFKYKLPRVRPTQIISIGKDCNPKHKLSVWGELPIFIRLGFRRVTILPLPDSANFKAFNTFLQGVSAMKASKEEEYQYPMAIKFLK
jgi:hypothetical protein